MSKRLLNTKSIVTISFLLLISICLFGIVLLYLELLKFSEVKEVTTENKELVIVSNTLAYLYKAEGAANVLIAESVPSSRVEYDSLMQKVYIQIDSLKKISGDSESRVHLDSVILFLNRKEQITGRIFQLLDSVSRQMTIPISRSTVLSKKDLSDLDQLLKTTVQDKEDTVVVQSKKKTFFQRVKDVFNTEATNPSVQTSKSTILNYDSIVVPTLTDTIAEYVNDIVLSHNKRNQQIIGRIVQRQSQLHRMNEELTIQINKILRDIEKRGYQSSLNLLHEKETALRRSSRIAYIVSIAALSVTIIFLILILRSLSYNQRYRKELEKSKKYAENLLSARERLILTITHDIKAPVSSIIGYMELLYKSKLPEKERYYIENMQNSAEHVLSLVKNLLDYHALESDTRDVSQMHFIPCILLRDICQSFIPLANKSNIELKFECDIDRTFSYESDPYRIRQIVNNLLSNAIKFTPEGGKVLLSSHIHYSAETNTEILQISVKDNGHGIGKDKQQLIFDEFKRLNKSVEGSGLGLTITRKLVHLLKGDIKLISELGKGSEFIINIPLMGKTEHTETQVMKKVEDESASIDTNKKILFIDDDFVQLNLFSEVLKRKGLTPSICQNSMDALELIQKQQFDLIFTDIQMPDMNGFELVERIRMATFDRSKTIPVIALSASSNISEQEFIAAGFSGFLPKPFTSDQLMHVIQMYLDGDSCFSLSDTTQEKGFAALIEFANDDKEASREIIHSFIVENEKNIVSLQNAFDEGDWDTVRKVCHKMLPLMRMIFEVDVVHALCEFERGLEDKDRGKKMIPMLKGVLEKANSYLEGLK